MFDVFGETPVKIEPSESSFDDPSFRQEDETFGILWSFDDFHDITEHIHGPFDGAFFISCIHEYFQEAGQHCEQPDEDETASAAFGDVSGMNNGGEQAPQSIDGYVAFTTLDLFSAVIAALPPF